MTINELKEVLSRVSFPGYTFHVVGDFALDNGPTYLQARFFAPCSVAGDIQPQNTRKWHLSKHMTRSEVIQTALKCVLTSVEHEAREQFKYRGHVIFGPHFDVERLVEMRKADLMDPRS